MIARDPAAHVPLRELAKASGLSPFQLCRTFRAHTGTTLTFHRHSLRLRLALDVVRDRSVSLTDLALDLGFSSHSHFTAIFRRHFGITPSQFRASARRFAQSRGSGARPPAASSAACTSR